MYRFNITLKDNRADVNHSTTLSPYIVLKVIAENLGTSEKAQINS